ncbi:MAG: hypothetical protein P4M01_10195 [Acidobacteriota bacterium]|nr:hypothetical protein [Acidobacteriota bacterium]
MMLRIVRLAVLAGVAALVLGQAPRAMAQSAPIPTQILNAKTVFVANGGSTSPQLSSADLYSGVYAAVRSWGRFILVNTPEEADLVFVPTFGAYPTDADNGTSFLKPQLTLTVLDPKTRIPLWSVTEFQWPKKSGVKAYDGLVAQIRAIAEAVHADKPAAAAVVKKEAPKAEVKKEAPKSEESKPEPIRKNW